MAQLFGLRLMVGRRGARHRWRGVAGGIEGGDDGMPTELPCTAQAAW